MPNSLKRFTASVVFLSLFTIMIGCGGSSTPPSAPLSAFSPEIVNTQDSFSFQVTDAQIVNANVTYTWPNSGTQATIDHSSVVTNGSATISMYDSNDSLVYSRGLIASTSEPSSVGVAGDWRIVVTLVNCSGTLNFSAQKTVAAI